MTKTLNHIFMWAVLAASISLSSCSLLQGSSTKKTTGGADSEVAVTSPKKGSTQGATQRHESASPERKSALAGKITGEWIIVNVGSNAIVRDEDMPYIYFDETDQRFYASNGCNTINGAFSLNGNNIEFSNVLSTLKDCPDVPFTAAISKVLADGVSVGASYEHRDNESYMHLRNRAGTSLLTLKRHNMEVLSGQWEVVKIDGEKVDNPEVNLFIDIPELKVHGSTGCNFFNGVILIDPLYSNSISFSQMGVTMRMCPNQDLERQYLVALERTHSYRLVDNNTLQLINENGKTVLTLKR